MTNLLLLEVSHAILPASLVSAGPQALLPSLKCSQGAYPKEPGLPNKALWRAS